ncbi:2-C-methyl-D-erythritol 4-phosphate cytidylyltransferase [Salibacterium salarium]|uniref:2-C-methyl-D-erythritol 4-phosphate cytidylyltransferase n=1 Tax=Salibacterium salarium TaxID=284579 RepID=A0A3R9R8A4_9BACI|nr:2-C-methyl-D-erythritol 4-phosphate cytidylyltransferase [Salibacterium salarium]RSL29436.1 2-C-methyl-D-erythritol 4-phosphate cytidylyltransferase [Salibacterium salarium]
MKYTVVIPAAGQGKRMQAGHNKQFLMLADRPLIIHTVSVFESDPWCEQVIVVANEDETEPMESLFQEWNIHKVASIVTGGEERQDSVFEGLKQLKDTSLVLIHDGARPFVTIDHIHALVEKASNQGAAVLGVRMKETVKKVEEGVVKETIERSSIWSVQTPQAFQFPVIYEAYDKADVDQFRGTDDTSLVERMGLPVHIVEGGYDNIKLTTPEDMVIAKAILKKRKRGEVQ